MTSPAPVTPRLPIAGGYQMVVKVDQQGQESVVVLGFGLGPGGPPTNAEALAQLDRFWLLARGMCTSAVTCTGAILRDVSGAETPAREIPAPTNPTGAAAGSTAFAAGAELIKWATGNGSRSGKGRTFVPGIPQGALQADGRRLTATEVSARNTAIGTYLSTSGTANRLLPAVLSFKRGTLYLISSGAISPVAGVQRRRMR